MLQVARTHAEFEGGISKRRRAKYGQPLFEVPESDSAYLWSQCLAPTYGINILGSRAALSFQVGQQRVAFVSVSASAYTWCMLGKALREGT